MLGIGIASLLGRRKIAKRNRRSFVIAPKRGGVERGPFASIFLPQHSGSGLFLRTPMAAPAAFAISLW